MTLAPMPSIATADRVSREQILEFARPRHRALLITYRADGGAQVSPVSCGVDPAGRVLVSTYPQRAKAVNVRRAGRAGVCVMSDDWDGPWAQLDGAAEVLDLPGAAEDFVTYYRSISGEHPDWDEFRAAMVAQGKCLIAINVDRWGPIATGGFPPEVAARM